MSGYLAQLAQNYRLVAHQTFNDSAAQIVKTDFGNGRGLNGTALFVTPQQILAVASKMFGLGGQADIHRGSNSVVVMAIPKTTFQQYGIRDLGAFDDHLADLQSQGKIRDLSLPNQFIVGHFHNGQFFAKPIQPRSESADHLTNLDPQDRFESVALPNSIRRP